MKAKSTRCVIVIDDHEASPSSSDYVTLRSGTRSMVSCRLIKMASYSSQADGECRE